MAQTDDDRAAYHRHNAFVVDAHAFTLSDIALALAEGRLTAEEAAARTQDAAQAVRDNWEFHQAGQPRDRAELFGHD